MRPIYFQINTILWEYSQLLTSNFTFSLYLLWEQFMGNSCPRKANRWTMDIEHILVNCFRSLTAIIIIIWYNIVKFQSITNRHCRIEILNAIKRTKFSTRKTHKFPKLSTAFSLIKVFLNMVFSRKKLPSWCYHQPTLPCGPPPMSVRIELFSPILSRQSTSVRPRLLLSATTTPTKRYKRHQTPTSLVLNPVQPVHWTDKHRKLSSVHRKLQHSVCTIGVRRFGFRFVCFYAICGAKLLPKTPNCSSAVEKFLKRKFKKKQKKN
jgi:hypothetical protein